MNTTCPACGRQIILVWVGVIAQAQHECGCMVVYYPAISSLIAYRPDANGLLQTIASAPFTHPQPVVRHDRLTNIRNLIIPQ